MKAGVHLLAVVLVGAGSVLAAGGYGALQPTRAQGLPGQMPPGAVHLQVTRIMDPSGFERPMVAAIGLIPVGWQTQGGVVWGSQGTCGFGYQFNWHATSPDGAMAAAVFPGMQWGFNNFGAPAFPGCPTLRINSVRQYLQYLVEQHRPGARILDFRRRPDIEQTYAQLNRNDPMPMGEMRTWVEAGEVLIGYNVQGREFRESAAAAVAFTLSRMQGIYAGQTLESVTGVAMPGYSFRAPDGYLDFRLAETIRKSLKATDEWSARINQHNAKIAQTNINGARERSQIASRNNNEIAEMNRRSYEERNRIMDRQHREFSEAIRGVETYDDPQSPTGTVQLSNQYDNAWRLNDGSYVLTNQPDFNPYAVYGQDGTRLGRTR